jgi:hypothetical protein
MLLFDAGFAALLRQLEASARTRATEAFSQSASSGSVSGASSIRGGGKQASNVVSTAAGSSPAGISDHGLEVLLEGADDSERLKSAMALLARQAQELETLRSRNKALAQVLI